MLPFSRYCSSKLTIFHLLQCCHFSIIVTKINFCKVGLHLLESQLVYSSWPFILVTTLPKTLIESCKHAVSFKKFVSSCQPWQTFYGKSFSKENLIVIVWERKAAGSSNLVKLVFRLSKSFEKKTSKNFFVLNAF